MLKLKIDKLIFIVNELTQTTKTFFVAKKIAIKNFIYKLDVGINKNAFWSALILCVVLGVILLLFDHFYYDKSFKNAAIKFLDNSSSLIKARINEYIKPFIDNAKLSAGLIKDNLLSPDHYEQFYGYFLNQLKNNSEFVNIYFADQQGNLFLMTKILGKDGKYNYVMLSSIKQNAQTQVTEDILDVNGTVISRNKHIEKHIDPRLRPWYIKAEQEKKVIWTNAYAFHRYSDYIMPIIGASVSAPIYRSNNQLIGVFGIDMQLDRLSYAVRDINFIKNTNAFIVNEDGFFKKIIFPYLQEKSISFSLHSNNSVSINDVNSSSLEHSFVIYNKTKESSFFYKIKDKQYLAFYDKLDSLAGSSWYIATIIPEESINWYLQRDNKILLLSLIISLSCVGFLFFMFSNQFAKVIKQILEYSNKIKNLDFSQKFTVYSMISEIKLLGQTVELMANLIKSFSRYVPSSLVREIIKSGNVSHLEGESRDVSILFADISGFSQIAENMKPKDLMPYLSEYFDKMTKVVYSKGGTLDKYIGDAIMCLWGAPAEDKRHALHACQCATMFFEALIDINKQWKLRGLPQISIRVSVSSGQTAVGNVGSSDRLSYTALGTVVNSASRLESLNKLYGSEILISENTYAQVKDQFLCRLVDRIAVRGQTKGIYIYEIFRRDTPNAPSRIELAEYSKEFFSAFKFYEVGDWEKSLPLFQNIANNYPKDKLPALYIERCKFLLKENNQENWDGIWKFG